MTPKLSNSWGAPSPECQFQAEGYTFNIEVKCPNFDRLEEQDLENHYRFNLFSRTDNMPLIDFIVQSVNEINHQSGPAEHRMPLRMDNKLKDYLNAANQKFAGANLPDNVNILVVCCQDAYNLQEFTNYLFQSGGFFNKNPNPAILPIDNYTNVDAVILCNLYHRHHNYFSKPTISDNWDFSKSFNLLFENPHRAIVEEKIKGVHYIVDRLLPNHTRPLLHYLEHGAKAYGLPLEFFQGVGVPYYIG